MTANFLDNPNMLNVHNGKSQLELIDKIKQVSGGGDIITSNGVLSSLYSNQRLNTHIKSRERMRKKLKADNFRLKAISPSV